MCELQCVAACYSVLQHLAGVRGDGSVTVLQCVCSVLQCVAASCWCW